MDVNELCNHIIKLQNKRLNSYNTHHKIEKKCMGNGKEVKSFVEKEISSWNMEIMEKKVHHQ